MEKYLRRHDFHRPTSKSKLISVPDKILSRRFNEDILYMNSSCCMKVSENLRTTRQWAQTSLWIQLRSGRRLQSAVVTHALKHRNIWPKKSLLYIYDWAHTQDGQAWWGDLFGVIGDSTQNDYFLLSSHFRSALTLISIFWQLFGCVCFTPHNVRAFLLELQVSSFLVFESFRPLDIFLPWFAYTCFVLSELFWNHNTYDKLPRDFEKPLFHSRDTQ